MMSFGRLSTFGLALLFFVTLPACQSTQKAADNNSNPGHNPLGTEWRQITMAGRRSGEGYFNKDGSLLIFQSEREPNNPFYQIYIQNLNTGEVNRVSPGIGKTTCGWIHPSNQKIMFSSTHHDLEAKKKQEQELKERSEGRARKYAWDYDENYDIFTADLKGRKLKNLTRLRGYDAEGSYSPDGQYIAFASNRHAFFEPLSPEDKKIFDLDPSYMVDIYIMRADGSEVRRLTHHKGYDGGPFFSPDGKKIVWRRFSADGKTAEIFTMNIDGSEQKQITRLNAMSWAPFYHPSGDYLIFTTNVHGYQNFELYIVDAEGKKTPQRVTFDSDPGAFDGLPVFHPNGQKLAWSRSIGSGQSQIFMANWDDRKARKLLDLPSPAPNIYNLSSAISQSDIESLISYFASAEMKGRDTGSPEEKQYGNTVATLFSQMGLKPAGDNNTYFQTFEFRKGFTITDNNHLGVSHSDKVFEVGKDWRPLAGSKNGAIEPTEVVFTGYGIVAPKVGEQAAYDSYQGIDVKNKWVMMFRYIPENVSPERRVHLQRYSRIPFKVMSARNQGAKGVIFVSGPNSKVKEELMSLEAGGVAAEVSIPVISITDSLAELILKPSKLNLKSVQSKLDSGEINVKPQVLPEVKVSARIEIETQTGKAQNVIASLKVPGAKKTLVIGAHGDHLGAGHSEDSLMLSSDKTSIHFGADDNASGMAGVMELAHYFSQSENRKNLKQNLLFVIWSGEEKGTLGSHHFVNNFKNKKDISAYLNMDMIGRFKNQMSIQGIGSSQAWAKILEQLAQKLTLPFVTSEDPYLPTDAMPFYLAEIPVMSFFTGAHSEYHTPRDQAHLINYPATEKIIQSVAVVAEHLATQNPPLPYRKVEQRRQDSGSRGFRLFLGTIPDYSKDGIKGVLLSGVVKGGPAEKAGLKKGDIIVAFGKMQIENIHDYVYSLQANKPGEKTSITIIRDGERQELEITPGSRE